MNIVNVGAPENVSALLLVGENEKPVMLTPDSASSDGYELMVSVAEPSSRSVRTLRAVVVNRTSAPVRLRSVTLGEIALTVEGDMADWWLGTLAPTPCAGALAPKRAPLPACERGVWQTFFSLPQNLPEAGPDEDVRSFRDWVTLYTDFGARGCVMGAVGIEADVSFHCRIEDGRVRVSVVSEMSDVVLAPGECRASEEVALVISPYEEALQTLLARLAENTGRRTHRKPPFGWCSWYDRYENIDAEHVAHVAEGARRLRDQLPLDFFQVDMGWETVWGDWRPHPDKFPGGLVPHVRQAESLNARPGLWFALPAAHDRLAWQNTHPDWFQRGAAGDTFGDPNGRFLDPTHPDVQRHIRENITAARNAGFTYFKFDYNLVRGRMHDDTKTRLQGFRDLFRQYSEAVGDDAFLLACSGFERGMMGHADGARIAMDSVPVWDSDGVLCLSKVIPAVCTTTLANGIFCANDPDVTYAGPRKDLTEAEWRTWHGFVGLLGGLVAFSDPLHELSDAEIRHLEILRPPARERGRSFGAAVGDYRHFGFVARRSWGDFATLQLWNPADTLADVPLPPRGLEALGDQFHVWAFWDEAYLGVHGPDFVAQNLPAHAPALLRLTPVSDYPALVGSTLHIGCGAAEVAGFAATHDAVTIALDGNAGARTGALFVCSPHPLALADAAGCQVLAVNEAAPGVYRLTLSGRQRDTVQTIRLEATL